MERPKPKYQVQKKIMDFSSKIRYVVNSTPCQKHNRRIGQPCWYMPHLRPAICNSRASKIFTGVPTERTKSTARAAFRANKENA